MACHLVGTFFCGGITYFTPLGGIGVAIFLLLSGYGLNESCAKSGLTNWCKKQLLVEASFFLSDEIRAEQAFSFFLGILLSEKKDYFRKYMNWKTGSLFILIGTVSLALKQTSVIRSAPQIIFNLEQLGIKLPCGFGTCCWSVSLNK